MNAPEFPGVFVVQGKPSAAVMEQMDKAMVDYTMRAARGEHGWICSDFCCSFADGMPDACAHGHQSCTDIITRDKRNAAA